MEPSIKKDIYSLYDWRDPICVSHYPFPTKQPDTKNLVNLIGLNEENKDMEPKALYVHIPFCDKICSFCPFNKVLKKEELVVKYIDALKREIYTYAQTKYVRTSHFGAINFGGGTPSSLSREQLIDIISFIKDNHTIDADAFISVEGSPSNFVEDKLEALYKIGVNRISFGIQTFNERLSEIIELPQKVSRSIEILEYARGVGYNNICIDLIYNLPGQTLEEWRGDVRKAIDMGIDHITLFSLCMVPGTKLQKDITNGKVPGPGDQNDEIDKFVVGRDMLRESGYIQYSIWDFAKPGKIDRGVQIYYNKQQDLFGIGPAAFGYINQYMYINKGTLSEYIKSNEKGELPILVGKESTKEDQMRGMISKSLRNYKLDRQDFINRFGQGPEELFKEEFNELLENELVEINEDEIRLTDNGGVWGNNVTKMFFEKPETFEWRASLAKGRMPKPEKEKDQLIPFEELQWEDGIKDLLEKLLERKPMFVRDKSRMEITNAASLLAIKDGRNIIQEKDLVIATLDETPAPFRPTAVSGFRRFGVDVDKYLKEIGGVL